MFANVGITVSNRSNVFGLSPAFVFGSGTGFLKSPWMVSARAVSSLTLPACTWLTNSVYDAPRRGSRSGTVDPIQ